jgi:hypothetical protein
MYIVAPDTDIKENKIFLLYEDIQMGSSTKTYMRKCVNIQPYMRRPFSFSFYQCKTLGGTKTTCLKRGGGYFERME